MQPRRLPFPFKFLLLKGPLSQDNYKIIRQAPRLVPPQNGYQESNYPSYPSQNVYPAYRPEYGYGNRPLSNRRNGNADRDSSEREQGENQYGSYYPEKRERNEGGDYLNQKNNYYGAQTDLPFLPTFKSGIANKESSGEKGNSQKNDRKTTEGKENSDD